MSNFFVVFLLVGLLAFSKGITTTETQTAHGGELNILPQLPASNENEDLLSIYMSLIFRDPETLFPRWDFSDWTAFGERREEWIAQLLEAYTNGTREDMIGWFMGYERDLARIFQPSLPVNTIMSVERVFTIPSLDRHYYTYMPIRLITSPTSFQWRFRPHLTVDDRGFMRYGSAYAIALGTYYGVTIGGIYELEFEDGEVIFGVLADVKRDAETDPTNRFHPTPGTTNLRTGNVVEFVMDDLSLWGYLSVGERVAPINAAVRERFPSQIVRISFVGVSEHATIR